MVKRLAVKSTLAVSLAVYAENAAGADPVSYEKEVLPILSENCFACHGNDTENLKGGIRLDTREDLESTVR